MRLKVYEYQNCSTCKKAIQYLQKKQVDFDRIPIVEKPPTLSELKRMLSVLKENAGTIKNLFNTSGVLYRELKIADQFKSGLSESDALKLLSQNGKLIKRPFVIGEQVSLVGFNDAEWKQIQP